MCVLFGCERFHAATEKSVPFGDASPSSSIKGTGRALVASPPGGDEREALDEALRGVRVDGGLLVVDPDVAPSIVPNPSREAALTEIQSAERALREYRTIDAISGFVRAVINDPTSARAFDGLSQALLSVREPSLCAAACASALEIDPDRSATHARHALVLQSEGRFEEAAEQWRQVIGLDPEHREARGSPCGALVLFGEL